MFSCSTFFFSGHDETTNLEEYPKKKMDIIRSKINGGHPSLVALEEVQHATTQDSNGKKFIKAIKEVLLGPQESMRRKLLEEDKMEEEEESRSGLTVAQQVDILLEAATDGSILRCCFAGWSPLV